MPCPFRIPLFLILVAGVILSGSEALAEQPTLRIPRVARAPKLEDFLSLRFPRAPVQNWGIVLGRSIRRNNESSHWPYITQRIAGVVQQFATLEGLDNISPGRNMQFIPYGAASRSRYLDTLSPGGPSFRTDAEGRAGLDAKLVLRDALTLDAALERTKSLKADFLVTYLLNPGTALYIGYTDGYENLDIVGAEPRILRRTATATTSTGRQFFVKLSYLWRY